MAAVWIRKLRVVMYTGLGRPVEPDVKFTKPGHARSDADAGGLGGRASGTTRALSPTASAAAARARRGGATNTGVLAGSGGDVRHARASGGRIATGSGRLDSAKKSATVSG